jgi:ATP-dependent RNA helicase SUPV3L1/SUV3
MAPDMPRDSAPPATETAEAVPQSTGPAESATLVALGDAPVAPEEADASADAVASNLEEAVEATSEASQSDVTSDGAEPNDAETTSEGADAAAEQPETAAAEPIMIDVWRMGRQQFQRRPERQRKRQPRVFNITPRPPKEAGNGQRQFRRERAAEAPKREGETMAAEAQASERPARAPDQRPRFPSKDERRRSDRHEDRRGARPTSFTTDTRSRDRAPDPDSPFAKLAALKAELEKNKKG